MSQAKVDQHKEQKKNRKQLVKKKRLSAIYGRIAGIIVLAAVVGWLGYSAYDLYEQSQDDGSLPTTVCDLTAINNFFEELSPDEAE